MSKLFLFFFKHLELYFVGVMPFSCYYISMTYSWSHKFYDLTLNQPLFSHTWLGLVWIVLGGVTSNKDFGFALFNVKLATVWFGNEKVVILARKKFRFRLSL